MFSAKRLLGGMMENGLGGGGMLGTAAKVAGVAAVGGIAYGAYRHYKAGGFGQGGPGLFGDSPQPGADPPAPGGNPFAGAQSASGNPFGAGPQAAPSASPFGGGGQAPGGNPWAAAAPAAVEPPAIQQSAAPATEDAEERTALLLVRTMIAAAYVDGGLDDEERGRILQAAAKAGMGDAEREALERELDAPHRPNLLFGSVADPELAKQVYLVTLLAIDRNTSAEQSYVAGLPLYLGLSPADVNAIHQQLGLPA